MVSARLSSLPVCQCYLHKAPPRVFTRGIVTTRNAALTARSRDHNRHFGSNESDASKAIATLRSFFYKQPGSLNNVVIIDTLRQIYPQHTVTQTPRYDLLKFAKAKKATAKLDKASGLYSEITYELPRDDEHDPKGRLVHDLDLGRYEYSWKGHDFEIFSVKYLAEAYERESKLYVLYPRQPGDIEPERSQVVESLIEAAATQSFHIEEEIWVYDRGDWCKNRKLWENVQAANWDDVTLNEDLKKNMRADVEGFFDCKNDYQGFSVPWKRGLILHGLPGNGKTISIKALMHTLSQRSRPIPTLYVKSIGYKDAHQENIREIFVKARHNAPCLLVLEDIDSLVTDKVKSFFLNEIDGLEGNDGIMIIGTTNYLDRLDPGISKRPSRFDRKYHFSLPATEERRKYCEFWRSKLATSSQSLSLPDSLPSAVAEITEGFSFAYMQEAFVAALLAVARSRSQSSKILAASGPDAPKAGSVESNLTRSNDLSNDAVWLALRDQIATLRQEMKDGRKSVEDAERNSVLSSPKTSEAKGVGFGS